MGSEEVLVEKLVDQMMKEIDEEVLRNLSGGCSGKSKKTGQLELFTEEAHNCHSTASKHSRELQGDSAERNLLRFSRWITLPL